MPRRAGFWIRTLAAFLDLLIMAPVYFGAAIILFAIWDRAGERELGERLASLILATVWLLYSMFEFWAAGTPGKMILRLRITAIDGSKSDFWRKFLRWSTKQLPVIALWLFAVTDYVPLYLLYGFSALIVFIGCLFALNDDHLTWHDEWAGTSVWRGRKVPDDVSAPPPAVT